MALFDGLRNTIVGLVGHTCVSSSLGWGGLVKVKLYPCVSCGAYGENRMLVVLKRRS
jgi:hypothetical protein